MKPTVLAVAAAAAVLAPAVARAQFPAEQTRGRITVVHVVPDAGEEDEAYVRRVLRKAPEFAGVVHVFLRPGGDEKAWGDSFGAPKGLAYFVAPGDYTAAEVDSTAPAVFMLDREGGIASRPNPKGEHSYANIPAWQTLVDIPGLNTDIEGANAKLREPAVAGYDVTTYFDGSPAKGKSSITAQYRGVTYSFASEANRLKFDLDPEHYVPAYGGWCAWAMVEGEKVDVDPETYKIVDGRLLLYYNGLLGNTLKKWNKGNEAELKRKADASWAGLGGRNSE